MCVLYHEMAGNSRGKNKKTGHPLLKREIEGAYHSAGHAPYRRPYGERIKVRGLSSVYSAVLNNPADFANSITLFVLALLYL